jgi:selenocysteine-specific elongation factor
MTDQHLRHFILATAGHVDHGKSALVQALTGIDPDRLPEEKARGITIDLGFADMRLAAPNDEKSTYAVGIVDVPGHEDFVRNMVAGVGSIDAALLVIAADDGWMPQTEEHLQILTYLGVRAAVIALSKNDLVPDERLAMAAVRSRLAGTPIADAPIVPTSVVSGRGIAELRSAIAGVLSRLAPTRRPSQPRLPVDRAFALKGVGTIVTGTLIGGSIARGQQVIVQPTGVVTRARTIQSHGHDIATAAPGSRVALNLPDMQPSNGADIPSSHGVARGDVVTVPATGRPSHRLCVLLTQSRRMLQASENLKVIPRIKDGVRVHLHHAAAAVPARVRLVEAPLQRGDHLIAMVKTQSPLLTFARDRFVLRDWSQRHTIAGGIVLDPLARMTSINRHRQAYSSAVHDLANHLDDPAAHLKVRLSRNPVMLRGEVLAQTDFSSAEVDAAINRALVSGVAKEAGPLIIEGAFWKMLRDNLLLQVSQHHASHPEQTGLQLTDLRTMLATLTRRELPPGTAAALERSLLIDSTGEGIVSANGIVRRSSHRPALPPRLRAAGDALRKRLAEQPLSPPSRKEICRTDLETEALRFLIATGAAVDLSPDIVLSAEAYSQAVEQLRSHLSHHGTATVSELKSILSSNRRVMIPLLERLDRDGITQRTGDLRRLR